MLKNEDDIVKRQRKIIDELQTRMARYEMVEQNLRDTQSRLDAKIDMLDRIHQYTQMAFKQNEAGLLPIIAEGIVDIFQLEVGAVFSVDYQKKSLVLDEACNLDRPDQVLPLSDQGAWNKNYAFEEQVVFCEMPVTDPLWAPFDLHSIIYMPLLDNDRNLQGVIMGGLTQENHAFYSVSYEELISPFTVFCQQMNGIMNNTEALHKARAAGLARTRFLANLSHEIRTPMNAINGMLQVAERSGDKDKIMECLSTIRVASDRLLEMLGDVLDISRIEEDRLTLGHDSFDLAASITALSETFKADAGARKQTFTVSLHNINAMIVQADKMRLEQVLSNLLSNAIKFTGEGGEIKLEAERIKRDGDKVLLRFSVTDNGIGIKDELLETIFVAFEQADTSSSRKYGGSGLGLAISQHIVGLMGGRIRVESEEGKGSAFHFSVWLDLIEEQMDDCSAAEVEPVASYDFTGHKIMVVDDVEMNRMIIRTFLEDTNAILIEADNGEEALECFKQSEEHEICAILMDIQMPVMDGHTATRMIRALPRKDAQDVGILAMTANVFQEDVQQALDAGMNAHIGKPVDYANIMRHLAFYINREESK